MQQVMLAFAFVTVCAPAFADNFSAVDLFVVCSEPNETWVSFCHGYIQAALDYTALQGFDICFDGASTRASLASIVQEKLSFLHSQMGLESMALMDAAATASAIILDAGGC